MKVYLAKLVLACHDKWCNAVDCTYTVGVYSTEALAREAAWRCWEKLNGQSADNMSVWCKDTPLVQEFEVDTDKFPHPRSYLVDDATIDWGEDGGPLEFNKEKA